MAALQEVKRSQPIHRKEDCSPFDIGVVFSIIRSSDAQKFELIEKICKPDEILEFPHTVENNKSRKFRYYWLLQHSWLAYSKYLDGAKVDKLVKSPLTCWTSAHNRIKSHCSGKCESHNSAVIRMDKFMRTMRSQAVPVDQQLNTILQNRIAKNRDILGSLFKTVIFCGRANIALQGHRDDNPRDNPVHGNFHYLLNFRVDSGDKILEEHLLNAPRNATYTSKTIQNEMITTVGKITDFTKVRESCF